VLKFKSKKALKEYLEEGDPDIMLYPEYENALVGAAETFYGVVAVYDLDIILEKLVKDGMESIEEADEFFRFNILGAYISDTQPIFLNGIKK
jgi:hypothetical protein